MPKARSASARPRTLEESAPLFAALGDETRLQVVARLCAEGPLSIVRLSSGAGVTRQAVAKHLRVLEGAGVVHGSKEGRDQESPGQETGQEIILNLPRQGDF